MSINYIWTLFSSGNLYASPVSEKDHVDLKEIQSAAETVPAAVEREENKETAEISGTEEVLSEAENDDFSPEDPDEVPDDESAEVDESGTDEEEDLPFVSEELVRRMSAYCNSPEFLQQMTWPMLEYAELPP